MASDRELNGGATSRTQNENGAHQAPAGRPPEPNQEAGEMELPLHARNRAAEIVKSPEKLREMVAEARAKADTAGSSSRPLAGVIEDLKTMFEMLRSVARGAYRPRKETLILIAGAVLYFVIPIDVIPDFIPVAGFVDDAAVIAWVVKTCKGEIELFKALNANGGGSTAASADPAESSAV